MKRFLAIGVILLSIACLLTVVIWYILQQWLFMQPAPDLAETTTPLVRERATTSVATTSDEALVPERAGTAATAGIPLRTLPLSSEQRALAETFVDVETFIITPAMQTCATNELGAERLAEILAGVAPSTREVLTLFGCAFG